MTYTPDQLNEMRSYHKALVDGLTWALDELDKMTPRHKSLMDSLPVSQRKVIGALTRLPVPAGATDIAREARLEPRKASMALTRLKARGIVLHGGRKWTLADPSLGAWYRARRQGQAGLTR